MFDARFSPVSGHYQLDQSCSETANDRKSRTHSIILSARESNVGGISTPSVLAVLRLTINSNLVGCSRAATWQAASQVQSACEVYLRNGQPGNTTLEAVEVEPPKLNKGETVVDAIERHRRRVRELRADLHRIESAPYPSSYAKQGMRAQIGQLARRGAPSVSSLVEHDQEIAWPTQSAQSKVYNAKRAQSPSMKRQTHSSLVAWLHRDALIASLDREIASEADDPAALTHEARQQREAEVMGDLLAVERDESALVWRAQAERMPVEHRADISPLAFLVMPAGHGSGCGSRRRDRHRECRGT